MRSFTPGNEPRTSTFRYTDTLQAVVTFLDASCSHPVSPRGSVRHDSFCWEKCKQAYLDCEKLQELQPREFTAIDNAVDWLKRHHKEVLVGSLIVIAGVAFVVVSAGAGLVVLAPAVLLASSAPPAEPHMVQVSP